MKNYFPLQLKDIYIEKQCFFLQILYGWNVNINYKKCLIHLYSYKVIFLFAFWVENVILSS